MSAPLAPHAAWSVNCWPGLRRAGSGHVAVGAVAVADGDRAGRCRLRSRRVSCSLSINDHSSAATTSGLRLRSLFAYRLRLNARGASSRGG